MSGALRRRVERLERAAEDAVQAAARRIAVRGTAGLFALLGEPVPADLLDLLRGDTLERAEADRYLVRRYREAGGTFPFPVRHEDWIDQLSETEEAGEAGLEDQAGAAIGQCTRASARV